MLEVSLRFRHGCAVNKLSDAYPEVTMAQWCNFAVEVIEIQTADPGVADAMERDLARLSGKGFKLLAESVPGGTTRTLLLECQHTNRDTVSAVVERHGCIYLPPIIYQGGWEHYRFVVFDEKKLKPLFKTLEERGQVELLRKRPVVGELMRNLFFVSTTDLLNDLTEKQARALLAAVEDGYYRVPRKTRYEDIARRRKTPRTTFEEHARKAESKIISRVAPYVALHFRDSKPAKTRK